jgi:hypothetical protein
MAAIRSTFDYGDHGKPAINVSPAMSHYARTGARWNCGFPATGSQEVSRNRA